MCFTTLQLIKLRDCYILFFLMNSNQDILMVNVIIIQYDNITLVFKNLQLNYNNDSYPDSKNYVSITKISKLCNSKLTVHQYIAS